MPVPILKKVMYFILHLYFFSFFTSILSSTFWIKRFISVYGKSCAITLEHQTLELWKWDKYFLFVLVNAIFVIQMFSQCIVCYKQKHTFEVIVKYKYIMCLLMWNVIYLSEDLKATVQDGEYSLKNKSIFKVKNQNQLRDSYSFHCF